MSGQLDASELSWILLVFSPDSDATFHVAAVGVEQLTNHSTLWWRARTPVTTGGLNHEVSDLDEPWSGRLDVNLTLGRGRWSSLLLVGQGLALAVEGASELQVPFPTTQPLTESADIRRDHYRPFALDSNSVLLRSLASEAGKQLPVSIQAGRLERIEWTNATATCPAEMACPDGGAALKVDSPVGYFQRMSYLDATLHEGQASGQGRVAAAAAGGPALAFGLEGILRLPEINLATCTPSPCPNVDDQTLTLQGRIDQANVGPAENRRLGLHMEATPTAAFSDEALIPSFARSAAPIVGAAILTALAFKLALFLAANHVRDPLAHPVRQALYNQILADPGVSYRELMRQLDVGNGSMAHHIRVLAKAGLVVDQTTRSRRRFFENHGRYNKTWQVVAALRDEPARTLLDWLSANPGVTQRFVLQHSSSLGWSRSVTQKRLNRLVAEGLVDANRQGRQVSYTPHESWLPVLQVPTNVVVR